MTRPMSTPLVGEIDEFIKSQNNLRPKTRQEYERSLLRFDGWLGRGTLGDLIPARVNAYVTSKIDAGNRYIARNDMATLKVFAKWLVLARHLRENPLVSVAVPKVSQKGRAPFHDRELDGILKAAAGSRIPSCRARDRLIVLLALKTSMRLNELRNIHWPDDIDLTDGMLYVRASKTDAGIRTVPLSPMLIAELRAYVHSYRVWGEKPGALFINQRGEPFTYNGFASIQGRIHERLADSGIDYKIHRLRNTWAAKARSLGWDLLDIQQVGGWTDIGMVRRYAGNKSASELRRLPTMDGAFGRSA